MSDKYKKYDFDYGHHGKKGGRKWLIYVTFILLVVVVVKMLISDKNISTNSINKTSIQLEIPKINTLDHSVEMIQKKTLDKSIND